MCIARSGYPKTKPSSRTGAKLAIAETQGTDLEAINQHALIYHNCGPTSYVHGIGPKHLIMSATMLMVLADEH